MRRQIAWDAARLMYERSETEYYRAKMKAARRVAIGWVKPADLPSNAEIRDQIELLARMHERDQRDVGLREMRLEALQMMRILRRYRPRLVGSVLTGHVRQGSDIDLHVFADSAEGVTTLLDAEGMIYDVERKRVLKEGEHRLYTHVHIRDRYLFELTLYASDRLHQVPKSSITGRPMERASIAQLEQLLESAYPGIDLEGELAAADARIDRFRVYESLLLPLEEVQENRRYHPESDVLFHSLQVFSLAREAAPYDEDFLLAALLHDVGKAIDSSDHVPAGLEALDGFISERTAWLIEHHMLVHAIVEGTLGARARRRLRQSEDYECLLLLGECDRKGRVPGAVVPDLDEALDYVRDLNEKFG
ncbi:MAG: HD domain-containing protein [Pirellulales bacterium]